MEKQSTLENFIQDSKSSNTTFCYLDIDDFSIFNLKYGFEKGNEILEKLIEIFNSFIFSWIKIDGDEYILKCEGNFNENKLELFKLVKMISDNLNITVSVGVTDNTPINSKLIFSKLKYNLSNAKHAGKNKIFYYK